MKTVRDIVTAPPDESRSKVKKLCPTCGQLYIPSTVLSKQQVQVLKLIAKGLQYKEIAAEMKLSPMTVRDYVKDLQKRLKIRSKVGLAMYYLKAMEHYAILNVTEVAEPQHPATFTVTELAGAIAGKEEEPKKECFGDNDPPCPIQPEPKEKRVHPWRGTFVGPLRGPNPGIEGVDISAPRADSRRRRVLAFERNARRFRV